jgi:UDP-glucose 4-epimerase
MPNNMASKRCLVTGGCGFIGSHLVEMLVAYGYDVRVADLRSPMDTASSAIPGVQYHQGDLGNLLNSDNLLEGVNTVFHLAWRFFPGFANRDVVADIQVNLVCLARLLQRCIENGVRRIIFFSTAAVYGPVGVSVIRETHPTHPISAYGIAKLAAEKYVNLYHHLYGLEYCILRPALPYGPGQNPFGYQGVVAVFIGRILNKEPIVIFGNDETITRGFFYVSDLAQAGVLAAESKRPVGTYNIGGKALSLRHMVDAITEIVGPDFDVTVNYSPSRPSDVSQLILETTQARQILGWEPEVTLQEGLTRTWEWIQQTYHPMIWPVASDIHRIAQETEATQEG